MAFWYFLARNVLLPNLIKKSYFSKYWKGWLAFNGWKLSGLFSFLPFIPSLFYFNFYFYFFVTFIYFFQFFICTFISLFSLDFYFPFFFGILFSLFSSSWSHFGFLPKKFQNEYLGVPPRLFGTLEYLVTKND